MVLGTFGDVTWMRETLTQVQCIHVFQSVPSSVNPYSSEILLHFESVLLVYEFCQTMQVLMAKLEILKNVLL